MKPCRPTLMLLVALLAAVLGLPAFAADDHADHDHGQPAASAKEWPGDPYLLPTDPVTDEPLAEAEKPVVLQHDGRELRFASQANADKFQADPAQYLAAVDAKMVEQQLPLYPLDKCIVSDEELGSMGKPIDLIHRNRLVRFCCAGCVRQFRKDPAATIAKLDEAVIAAQKADYPLDTCVVSDMKLGSMGEPIDKVYGNRLVRFCCSGCIKKFTANPQAYLDKLGPAAPHQAKGAAAKGHGQAESQEGHDHAGHSH